METNLPKHEPSNPYNYTKVQYAKRTRDIKAMLRDFPTVPPMWAEWLYDVIENTPQDEVEAIINEGKWEVPSKFKEAPGGILNTVEVFNEDGTPYEYPKEQLKITAE